MLHSKQWIHWFWFEPKNGYCDLKELAGFSNKCYAAIEVGQFYELYGMYDIMVFRLGQIWHPPCIPSKNVSSRTYIQLNLSIATKKPDPISRQRCDIDLITMLTFAK